MRLPVALTNGAAAGFAALLGGAPLAPAAAQSHADSIVSACVAAAPAGKWMEMGAAWSAEVPGSWTNDSLRRVLIAIGDSDQAVRQGPFADSMKSQAWTRRMAVRDSIDLLHLKAIVAQFGWPSKSMVGAKGEEAAFVVAQHNLSYQPKAIRLMKEDRMLTVSGRPQRYATQLKPPAGGVSEFYPIDSVGRVEARRAAVGLPPMSVYLCMMRGLTGRAVNYPPVP
jgi:hypothetical protein